MVCTTEIDMNKDQKRAYAKQRYHNQPEIEIARIAYRKEILKLWLKQYKSTLQCECGESHPACIDFHHIDPDTKAISAISAAIYRGWSIARIQTELAKCKVLCANCHKIIHSNDIHQHCNKERQTPTETELLMMSKERRSYYRNRVVAIKRKNDRRRELFDWFRNLKSTTGCANCHESRYQCLEYHHLNSSTKHANKRGSTRNMTITKLIVNGSSITTILAEISKCVLLCANCHRKIHYEYDICDGSISTILQSKCFSKCSENHHPSGGSITLEPNIAHRASENLLVLDAASSFISSDTVPSS